MYVVSFVTSPWDLHQPCDVTLEYVSAFWRHHLTQRGSNLTNMFSPDQLSQFEPAHSFPLLPTRSSSASEFYDFMVDEIETRVTSIDKKARKWKLIHGATNGQSLLPNPSTHHPEASATKNYNAIWLQICSPLAQKCCGLCTEQTLTVSGGKISYILE